jgi:hypothetical protein
MTGAIGTGAAATGAVGVVVLATDGGAVMLAAGAGALLWAEAIFGQTESRPSAASAIG